MPPNELSISATDRRMLEAFLTESGDAPLPPVELLHRTRLAAYAYTRLRPGDPNREGLLPALLTGTTAHQTALAAVSRLVGAWQEAGIEALVFKGLALATHAYEVPGARYYHDADVLIDPVHTDEARRVAEGLGWAVRRTAATSGDRYSHALMMLRSPDGRLVLDVHRFVLHSFVPWHRLQERMTGAAWAASTSVPFGEIAVRMLNPRDSALMGLVLNRAWSTDNWRLKPQDYLDFRMLVNRHDLTQEDLEERAQELGCLRTLKLFMQRCDPFAKQLDLHHPTAAEVRAWVFAVAHERRPHQIDLFISRVLKAPVTLSDVINELPGLLKVLRLLDRNQDLPTLLDGLDARLGTTDRPPDASKRVRVVRGVKWGLRFLRVRPEGDCLPFSLAVTKKLRRLGAPAVFVSGVRSKGGAVQGHAWVELDGQLLPEFREPLGANYRPNVKFPREQD